jgi:hypothetical protein
VTVPRGRRAQVRFDIPVDRVSVAAASVTGRTVRLPTKTPAGSLTLAAAARPWERLGAPVRVTWFPQAARPVVLVSHGPSLRADPLAPIRLTFSAPVSNVLRGKQPTLVPSVPGRWAAAGDHVLVFRPSGRGAPFNSQITVGFPATLVVATGTGAAAHTGRSVRLSIASASFLRLQQLLAMEGYLPLDWTPAHAKAKQTMRTELADAVVAPAGRFRWRYPQTPAELQALWTIGEPNEITRGAVMMFQHDTSSPSTGSQAATRGARSSQTPVAGKRRSVGTATSTFTETCRSC